MTETAWLQAYNCSLHSSNMTTTKVIAVLRAHKRVSVITFSWVAFWAFWLIPNWRELGPFYFLVFSAGFVMLIPSQLFWIGRVLDLGERFIPGKPRRAWLAVIATVAYNFAIWGRLFGGDSTHLTLRGFLIDGVWSVWLVGSMVGFGLVIVFWTADLHDSCRSAGLSQSAQGCGRPRRRSHAWGHSSRPALARPPPVARADRRRGKRRAVCGRGLRAFLRPA